MSIKDLFSGQKTYKIATSSSMDTLGNTVESADYIREYSADRQRFVPAVDFNNPSQFAFFGSAEEYYRTTIERIHNTYPYDGSRKEKSNTKKKRIINLNKKKESIKKEKDWVETLQKMDGLKLNEDWIAMQEKRFSDNILHNSALAFFTGVEIEKKYKYKQPLSAFINWCKKEEQRNGKTKLRSLEAGKPTGEDIFDKL